MLYLKKSNGVHVSTSRLTSLREVANIPEGEGLSHTQIIKHLHESTQSLRTLQKNHRNLRSSYLESLAEAVVLHRNPNLSQPFAEQRKSQCVEKELKQLKWRETMRKTYIKIGHILSPTSNKGLYRVDIPDPSHGNPNEPKTWT